jgi:hypothetical protein
VTAPRLIVPLLAASLGAFGGYALMHKVGPDVSRVSKDSAGVEVDRSSGPPPELNGSDPKSMLRPEQLSKALAIMGREGSGPGTKVLSFRLAPGRINATIDADGKSVDLYLIPGGKVFARSVSPIAPSRLALEDALPLREISATGPSKMVRALRTRSGISPDDVNYLVADVDPVSHKPAWLLYLKSNANTYYRAAINGAHPSRCC